MSSKTPFFIETMTTWYALYKKGDVQQYCAFPSEEMSSLETFIKNNEWDSQWVYIVYENSVTEDIFDDYTYVKYI